MGERRTVHMSTSAPTSESLGNLNDVWIWMRALEEETYDILGIFVLIDIFSEDAQTAGGDGHLIYTYRWVEATNWRDEDTGESWDYE